MNSNIWYYCFYWVKKRINPELPFNRGKIIRMQWFYCALWMRHSTLTGYPVVNSLFVDTWSNLIWLVSLTSSSQSPWFTVALIPLLKCLSSQTSVSPWRASVCGSGCAYGHFWCALACPLACCGWGARKACGLLWQQRSCQPIRCDEVHLLWHYTFVQLATAFISLVFGKSVNVL